MHDGVVDRGSRLDGGNTGGAVRLGDTVRRATGPWTPAVHSLLDHLQNTGFDRAPQALGLEWRASSRQRRRYGSAEPPVSDRGDTRSCSRGELIEHDDFGLLIVGDV